MADPDGDFDRREFLRRSAAAGVALAAAPALAEEPRVRRYATLGKTGLRVSDIGFGSYPLDGDERLVHRALDRGINYFDTAESYMDGRSEETLGRALCGKRKDVVLVSKALLPPGMRATEMMRRLEGSLHRLQTDHLDIYFSHAVNDPKRLSNPEWPEFTARAKEQGKIRFVGMSGHGGRLVKCVEYAMANDLVDVFLTAFNFGQDPAFYARILERLDLVALQPKLPEALARAKKKGIGVVAMKTLRGAANNDVSRFQRDGATFNQAAFRWVLSHDVVDSLVVTMETPAQVDEYLGASGWTRTAATDGAVLARYEAREGGKQCRYGCDDCVASCPAGVVIPEVLRTRMYAEDYGHPKIAKREYRALEVDASACASCSGEPCAAACPHGISIPELTKHTGRLLG